MQRMQTLSGCGFCKSAIAPLPRERTEVNTPFNVIGVDFAGPVKYRDKRKEEQIAYVVLYSCSLTRGVFLELLLSLETREFIKSLKCLIARGGRPSKIYSDNGQTFVAAAKWLIRMCRETLPALNPTAPVFRPRRNAAVVARLRMQEVAEEEGLD